MAIEPVVSTVYLDIYDHDTTPTTIKTIASDNKTRFVQAYLQEQGAVYRPDPTATAYLIALRPDKSVVIGPAELIELVPAVVDADEIVEPVEGESSAEVIGTVIEPAIYGPKAEIKKEMTAIVGTITFQFKIVQGDKELRTEIFKSNNGINVEDSGDCVIYVTE